jgi:hypothetical protein
MILTNEARRSVVAPPSASAHEIRQVLEHSIRDIGYPRMDHLPAAPFTLPREAWAELGEASITLLSLAKRAVLEAATTSVGRVDALGAPRSNYPMFTDDRYFEESFADCFCRPDVIFTSEGPKFIELNVGGGFAGVIEAHCRLKAWQVLYGRARGPATGNSLELLGHDPLQGRAKYFGRLAKELGLPPRVAVAGTVKESVRPTHSTRYFDLDVDCLRDNGLESDFFDIQDVQKMRSSLTGLTYGLGFFHINPTDVLALGLNLDAAREARRSDALLLAPQTATMLANKVVLAWLSTGTSWMTEADKDFVAKYVPWTRLLTAGFVSREGDVFDVIPWTLANRDRLVIKRGFGSSADGVIMGADTSAPVWAAKVSDAALAGGWVVQEAIESVSFHVPVLPGEGKDVTVASVHPIFSPFIFGGTHTGMYARFFSDGRSGIVSVNGTSASDNVVIPVDDLDTR